MKISALKENFNDENRVAITPDTIKLFQRLGLDVLIENGAGNNSGYLNNMYEENGAKIVTRNDCLKANICLCVKMPNQEDLNQLNENSVLIGILNPYENKKYFNTLKDKRIISCCMELIPRISRAQSMDVLSSQANLAGYRSVIDAAEQFGKAFPMMMTAAGRVNPAKVMVLGVGVAGLQAIATAKRLGAVVSATDVRSVTKEQVESLGGKFIMVEDEESTNAETISGYAKEMSDEYKKKQAKLISDTIAKQDIVICTALIPGKKAPVLISQEMVESMVSGSVVVDLAVEAGGNCPLSKLGKVINHKGVKVIGYANVPGKVAKDASALYSKNIFNFLSLIINKEEKKINLNWEDEIVNAVVLTNEGKLRLEKFN
ncbi:MAG: NAD(P)(+) transhydrogenase (Re/Si-specific) subunit alpha [Pelagibacteraceae bacterium]|nr:NAD(P)(+) transhydrogenase (Re/Si-specific) subunit alpha [Pelagibacteraceae bacterium]|tara:strand:- start:38311 stop:39432 length:1122 start_codon:yes stop_codon:yes gene_type:complete